MSLKVNKKNKDKTLLFLNIMLVKTRKMEARPLHLSTYIKISGKRSELESTSEFICSHPTGYGSEDWGAARTHSLNQKLETELEVRSSAPRPSFFASSIPPPKLKHSHESLWVEKGIFILVLSNKQNNVLPYRKLLKTSL